MERVSLPETDDNHLPFDYSNEQRIFEKTFKILNVALASKAFGQASKNFDSIQENFSIYQYESITLALQEVLDKIDPDNAQHISLIRDGLMSTKLDPAFKTITTGGGKNTKNKLNERIEYVSNVLRGIDFG